jgi:uncharacterized membrane protein
MPPGFRRSFKLANPYERYLLDRLARRRQQIGGFRAKANRKRTAFERVADFLLQHIGSVPFLVFHVCLFVVWLVVNLGLITGALPFDPFPFGLLTMILSMEQSLLTVFILISQNRAADIAELRNELDLQVSVLAEEEISKALRLLHLIGVKLDIDEIINDAELRIMETSLDHEEMEKETLQELGGKVRRVPTASEWTRSLESEE